MGIEPMYRALQTPAPQRVMPAQGYERATELTVEGEQGAGQRTIAANPGQSTTLATYLGRLQSRDRVRVVSRSTGSNAWTLPARSVLP